MESLYTGLGQIAIAVVKVVLLLMLPLVSIVVPLVGIPIPGVGLRGLNMFNTGNMLILIPMIVYMAMMITALGPIQKFSWISAAAALIIEFVFLFIAPALLNSGDIGMLIDLIPSNYHSAVEFGLQRLAKPGIGIYLNLGLTILYIVWYVVGGMLFGNSGSGRPSGTQGFNSRPGISSNHSRPAGTNGGGINRPRI